VDHEQQVVNNIIRFSGDVSGGTKPVLYVRGNHETRGEYAGKLLEALGLDEFYYTAEMGGYTALHAGSLTPAAAAALLPDRATLALVWRYLAGCGTPFINEAPMCLCRKIVRWSGQSLSLEQLMTCLDIFSDVGLLNVQRLHKYISIQLTPGHGTADLGASATMQTLLQLKESD
jgi:hypothetical protein